MFRKSHVMKNLTIILSLILVLVSTAACSGVALPPGETPAPGAKESSLVTTLPNPPLSGIPPIIVPTGLPGATSATGATVTQPVIITLTAQNMTFDKTSITVPAGAKVTIIYNNMDKGVSHTFSLYKDSSATDKIFVGAPVTGPGTVNYNFTAPSTPGNYYFRDDVNPTTMNGTFIVQ